MQNTGTETWPAGCRLALSGNWPFARPWKMIIPQATPGQTIDVELAGLKAPLTEGNFVGLCTLQSDKKAFGDHLWIS